MCTTCRKKNCNCGSNNHSDKRVLATIADIRATKVNGADLLEALMFPGAEGVEIVFRKNTTTILGRMGIDASGIPTANRKPILTGKKFITPVSVTVPAGESVDVEVSASGATSLSTVTIGTPNNMSTLTDILFCGFVSSPDVVKIRFFNKGENPITLSGNYTVRLID